MSSLYQLWVDKGRGFKYVAESKSDEVLKSVAKSIHQECGYNTLLVYEIRLHGAPCQRSSNNRTWRMRWKRVPGIVAA